jgi:hypothetical protein
MQFVPRNPVKPTPSAPDKSKPVKRLPGPVNVPDIFRRVTEKRLRPIAEAPSAPVIPISALAPVIESGPRVVQIKVTPGKSYVRYEGAQFPGTCQLELPRGESVEIIAGRAAWNEQIVVIDPGQTVVEVALTRPASGEKPIVIPPKKKEIPPPSEKPVVAPKPRKKAGK